MNCLLFYKDGFIKRFPLDKPLVTIGRSSENDLVIMEDFISRNHVKIHSHEDSIIVQDLGSTNGVNVGGEKVKKAYIKIGESFILGKMEFVLKRGSLDEFKLAKELIPIFDTIGNDNEKTFDNVITRYVEDVFNETLKAVMQVGLKKNDFKEFILDLPTHLSNLTDFGSLFIVSRQEDTFDVLLSVRSENIPAEMLKRVVERCPGMYREKIISRSISTAEGINIHLYTYSLKCGPQETALIFLINPQQKEEESKLEAFLSSFVTEIELLAQLLTGKEKTKRKEEPSKSLTHADEIVVENNHMKELIKQTRKIADSDIFVLIQGESGTGKELFARLIHKYSRRNKQKFVAINCAAIPESLLESELFGHEKGAFTGAYTQKKGKLEIASAGTLVLDEIGDMPVNLQSKLLRALQEKEFYRVGGTTPINVDLRIISITNKDLKQLIKEEKFREDLYYRLVHRSIVIPPLRERKEDISALINFFTHKFCQQNNKKIKGYSVKAFETLQNYHWKGNVRQLENEIRSIVNLTDDGETVSYDILSEEIRTGAGNSEGIRTSAEKYTYTPAPQWLPGKIDKETEKVYILELLEKNNWNKSQTARDLNMTYRGLHKKMQRLGIEGKQ
ncbi:MAG: sigma 54-dependent Fis family transcriptional regulator [Candidatus Aminicenantes bacterium]|nr:MAG: sigma 54-dependent Fis family transcriptional regulator [Candidatus Aminicenantes bacterium]